MTLPRLKRKPPPPSTKITSHCPSSIMTNTSTQTRTHLIFFLLLLLCTSTAIIVTCTSHPLFPLQTDNLEWNNAWLMATVIDYYGACLCLCGVIVGTEEDWFRGALWSLGCCLLGSPICCLWIILRIWKHGSSGLCLQNDDRRSRYPSIDGGVD
mmetsp:Transcript_853/g.1837  ORF Transcript_853/g.1837 Transcript_853/m.1837 type:complete len:154 (+) Transcript_853:100-561(+)